jgi:hypothetical protein
MQQHGDPGIVGGRPGTQLQRPWQASGNQDASVPSAPAPTPEAPPVVAVRGSVLLAKRAGPALTSSVPTPGIRDVERVVPPLVVGMPSLAVPAGSDQA